MGDELYSETGRYEVLDVGGKCVLLDTMTGKVWVLRNLESGKPVLIAVSTATMPKEDKTC